MSNTLALPTHLWAEMTNDLRRSEESAGVLLAAPVLDGDRVVLLAQKYRPVADRHYLTREPLRLALDSAAWMPALGEAAEAGLQAIFVHTHPGGDPSPSELDERVDEQLGEVFQRRLATRQYASLILGGTVEQPSFTGRLSTGDLADARPLHYVRVVGQRLQLLNATGTAHSEGATDVAFDRQVLAFGAAGQATLRALRVGVVGAGGTGSSVIEQLLRLGVGELVVLDDDRVTSTNVTRVYGSTMRDIGELKVDVAARNAERIGLGTQVIPVAAKVSDAAGIHALRSCDAVFGCTDDNLGRTVLSRLPYWFLMPVIDMGVLIRAPEGAVTHLNGRVTVMSPGEACLLCRQRIDLRRARDESETPERRRQLAEEGYASGLDDPDPSVITYTTAVAAQAVGMLLQRLFGFGPAPLPSELLLRLDLHEVRSLGANDNSNHLCRDPAQWARGDQEPPLGMPGLAAAAA